MSLNDSIKNAIANADSECLVSLIRKLTKEEVQKIAYSYRAKSATLIMFGTWVEECDANLLDSSGEVVFSDIRLERGFKGWLNQVYDVNNLHSVAIAVLDENFTGDYDEDFFSVGDMLFGEEQGYGASTSENEADCKSEERTIQEDIDEEEIDPFEYQIDEHNREMIISNAYISTKRLIIELDGYPEISIDVSGGVNYLVRWFVFSVLYLSSGKTIEELDKNSATTISDFMNEYFQISV